MEPEHEHERRLSLPQHLETAGSFRSFQESSYGEIMYVLWSVHVGRTLLSSLHITVVTSVFINRYCNW